VLLKVHQQVARAARVESATAGRLVPNDLPTNELLGVVDVLVTDYSSVMFDFLATDRAVVLFTPDLAEYARERGLYLDPAELPGPTTVTVEELARVVGAVGTGTPTDPHVTHAEAYAAARDKFAPHDDGSVTQRVLDVVIHGRREGLRVRPVRRDGRPTVLIHPGGLMTNGITSSALNLLHTIDHGAFDVSIVRNHSPVPAREANVAKIDPRVRQFLRIGGMAMSKRHYLARRRLLSGRIATLGAAERRRLDLLFEAEWERTVGQTRFDYTVDFGGYSPLWAYLISSAPAGSRSIWLHNDLKSDQMRTIDGRRPHEDNLRGVFSTYNRFDRLVSVSAALCGVNARRLAEWAPPERFIAARNLIDQERVLAGAAEEPPEHLRALTDDKFAFVTVGRLSPEKNHIRLIEAFAAVHHERADTRLVVIGSGPSRDLISARVAELKLSDSVTLTGALVNPWALMARCDCLVISSDYEGQPMTILEARTLGVPVVTTDFASVSSAVPTGDGLIVRSTVTDLADGMRAAMAGDVPHPPFDPVVYNATALGEFYAAIGVTTVSS
jgi:glycosyltransferase involved in cell wall biosynthesis